MNELKACPFCHGRAHAVQYKDGYQWLISCLHCPCELYTDYKTEQEAINLWNTRPQPPESKGDNCHICNEKTNSLAGNPSEWATQLPSMTQPGKMAAYHIGCVMARVIRESKGVVWPEKSDRSSIPFDLDSMDAGIWMSSRSNVIDEFKRLNPWLKEQE